MKRISYCLLCLCLLFSEGAGQKRSTGGKAPASAYKLIALKVTGTTSYTDKEILAASGLQMGQNVADGDFKEAVQRLGDSGMFADAAYSYTTSASGTRVEMKLDDVDRSKLVPARFENFVWFTDDELHAALKRRAPLFNGSLPLSGALADHVSEALQAMLTEKRLPGRVDYLREAHDEVLIAINYRVEEVSIYIRSVEFPGASPEQVPLLTAAVRHEIGATYGRPALAAVAELDLLPVFLERGYLKAEFAPSNARVIPQNVARSDSGAGGQASSAVTSEASSEVTSKVTSEVSSEVQVDAIIPVTPGRVYSTSKVDWKGNSVIVTNELSSLVHLPVGQPADAVRLIHDLDKVQKLYRSRGYITVQIKPEATTDDEKSAVGYILNVREGDLYKMGDLEITGLDTQSAARMRAAWTLAAGQPYNADYPKKFVADTGPLLPRSVRWGVNIHETPDAKDKTVDVEVHFKQQ
jgi:outer membrane protein assembly factor BamA